MTDPKRRFLPPVVFALIFGASATAGLAQTAAQSPAEDVAIEVPTAPVVIDGTTLFRVRGIQSFPAAQRAGDIAGRIIALAKDPAFGPESITLARNGAIRADHGGVDQDHDRGRCRRQHRGCPSQHSG